MYSPYPALHPNPGTLYITDYLIQLTNLLIFDLANQRVAGDEDILNKPWRPIPSKRMDSTQMRYWLIVAIPIVIAYNHFFLGVGIEASLLAILTWIYNDLRGGDDNCIVRNFVIACAFGLYNIGSLKVASTSFIHPYDKTYTNTKAVPATNTIIPTAAETTTIWASLVGSTSPTSHVTVSSLGYWWVFFVSGIIFTTMHIQDFKDIEGDRTRGRNSLPIVYGRRIAGWTIAVPAILWSLVCARFWALSYFWASFPIGLSLIVAWRCVMLDGKSADRRTWQLWTLWTALVYLIPLMSTPG